MDWSRIKQHLLPGAAERDEGFRQEILRIAHLSLRVVGGVQVGTAVLLPAARLLVSPDTALLPFRVLQALALLVLGIGSFLAARGQRIYPYARLLAALSGVLTALILIWSSLLLSTEVPAAEDYIPNQISLVMLVAVAAVPLRPMQALALGFTLVGLYLASSWIVAAWLGLPVGPDPSSVFYVVILSLLCSGLATVVYGQRYANYRSYLSTLQACDELRQLQSRMMLTENAASLGRLAAAVSHELNSPVGALISGVDTLLLLAARQATAPPEQHERLVRLQAEVRKSVQESAQRLQQIVARMQRFTNLDKADVQFCNVNELVSDVASLLAPELREKAHVELDLHPVAPLLCRPQQLSAVFGNLLNNAMRALRGRGRVLISTRQINSEIEVKVQDSGRGMGPDEISGIFDPKFKITDGRVATGNWSMFSARQIVREHGGDIRISSEKGRGTTVSVTLPCAESAKRPRLAT